jgi:hypothetical protein
VHGVCAALYLWANAGRNDPSVPLTSLQSGIASPETARQQIVQIYAAATSATNQLISATKKIGTPQIAHGRQVAADYLQTLGDIRHAVIAAHRATEHTDINDRAALIEGLTAAVQDLRISAAAIGNPLTTLNESPTLVTAMQADSGCATASSFFRTATSSSLQVEGCTTQDEHPVDCSQAHWGEVTRSFRHRVLLTA